MTFEQIRAFAKAAPFQPFVIETEGGGTFPVNEPEHLQFIPNGRTLIVWTMPGGVASLLDASYVAALRAGNEGVPAA